jgi:single-stranded-DNA-specific exonuclease
MIRTHTPCAQVRPLVAQIWRSRLPRRFVIAAKTRYRPGWVHFSARRRPGTNLVEFVRKHQSPGADPETYGNGHEQAAGGALSFAVWNDFVHRLGFGSELQVLEPEASQRSAGL